MFSEVVCTMRDGSPSEPSSECAASRICEINISCCPHQDGSVCRISQVFSYIQSAPIHAISDESAARRVGLSSSRFRHLFKEHTGESFHQYVIRVRMERACQLLRTTELTIQQIGERIGVDLSHFRRDFKRAFGTTPASFRKINSKRHSNAFDAA